MKATTMTHSRKMLNQTYAAAAAIGSMLSYYVHEGCICQSTKSGPVVRISESGLFRSERHWVVLPSRTEYGILKLESALEPVTILLLYMVLFLVYGSPFCPWL